MYLIKKSVLLLVFFLCYAQSYAEGVKIDTLNKYNGLLSEAENLYQEGDISLSSSKVNEYIEKSSIYGCQGYSLLSKLYPSEKEAYEQLEIICNGVSKEDPLNPILKLSSKDFQSIPEKFLPHYLYFSLLSQLSTVRYTYTFSNFQVLENYLLKDTSKANLFYDDLSFFYAYMKKDSLKCGEVLNKEKEGTLLPVYYLFDGYLNKHFTKERALSAAKLLRLPIHSLDLSREYYKYVLRIIPKNEQEFKDYFQLYIDYKQYLGDYTLYDEIIPVVRDLKNIDSYKSQITSLGGNEYFQFIKDYIYIRNFLNTPDSEAMTLFPDIETYTISNIKYYSGHKENMELGFGSGDYTQLRLFPLLEKLIHLRKLSSLKLSNEFLEVVYKNEEIIQQGPFQIYKDKDGNIILDYLPSELRNAYFEGIKKAEMAEKYSVYYSGVISSGAVIPNPFLTEKKVNGVSPLNQISEKIKSIGEINIIYGVFLLLSIIGIIISVILLRKSKTL